MLTKQGLNERINAVKEISSSQGWAFLMEELDRDVLSAAFGLSDRAEMTEAEIHFARGAIRAARNFKVLPTMLLQKWENDLLLQEANISGATK